MDNPNDALGDALGYARWALFAGIGGAVGYLMRSTRVNARDFIIETVGAGFVGSLVSMACSTYQLGTPQTGVLVGVSALIGARTSLGFLKSAVLNRLKLPTESEDGGNDNGNNGKAS